METSEQLKQITPSYPALAHKNRPTIMKNDMEEVLTNLRIYVKPDVKLGWFDVKLHDIFKPFTKINTDSYSKLLKYVTDLTESLTQWEIQRNFAVWCATSGCGVAMTHLLSNIFTNDPQFKIMSQELKEKYENKFNLPNPVMSLFGFHVYYQTRRILKEMRCSLPTDGNFSPLSNDVDKTKMGDICDEFGVKLDELPYRFKFMDEDEQKISQVITLVDDYRLRGSSDYIMNLDGKLQITWNGLILYLLPVRD